MIGRLRSPPMLALLMEVDVRLGLFYYVILGLLLFCFSFCSACFVSWCMSYVAFGLFLFNIFLYLSKKNSFLFHIYFHLFIAVKLMQYKAEKQPKLT